MHNFVTCIIVSVLSIIVAITIYCTRRNCRLNEQIKDKDKEELELFDSYDYFTIIGVVIVGLSCCKMLCSQNHAVLVNPRMDSNLIYPQVSSPQYSSAQYSSPGYSSPVSSAPVSSAPVSSDGITTSGILNDVLK
jgi:hypothetical protein